MKINIKPPTPTEYLSKEILEEEFIKVFAIYHWIQKITGVCRVDVRDRFITIPSIPQKIYSILCFTFGIVMSWFGFNTYADILDTRLHSLSLTLTLLIVLGTLCSGIHGRFLNNDDNVAFYIKMQEIDRIMNIQHCKPINTILCRMNMFTIITMYIIAVLIFFITLFTRKELIYAFLAVAMTYGSFLLELAYCSNLLAYFSLRVRLINAIMNNHIQEQSIKIHATPNLSIKYFASKSHNFVTSETDIYLKIIFECFYKYQDLYRFQVLIFFAGLIIVWGLSAQVVIEAIQANVMGSMEWIAMSTNGLFAYFMVIFLCLHMQVFYSHIKETKRLSVRVMSMYFDGPMRDKAKKMYKIIQVFATRFSVYDMWYMDASVLISVLGLMTTIFVTILQFAYL